MLLMSATAIASIRHACYAVAISDMFIATLSPAAAEICHFHGSRHREHHQQTAEYNRIQII